MRQLAAILSVSDRLIANQLTKIFRSFFCLNVDCPSVHDSPKTRNCTNQRNHNQNRQHFSFFRRSPWAYFLNGPNAAASTAPTLIRHWVPYNTTIVISTVTAHQIQLHCNILLAEETQCIINPATQHISCVQNIMFILHTVRNNVTVLAVLIRPIWRVATRVRGDRTW